MIMRDPDSLQRRTACGSGILLHPCSAQGVLSCAVGLQGCAAACTLHVYAARGCVAVHMVRAARCCQHLQQAQGRHSRLEFWVYTPSTHVQGFPSGALHCSTSAARPCSSACSLICGDNDLVTGKVLSRTMTWEAISKARSTRTDLDNVHELGDALVGDEVVLHAANEDVHGLVAHELGGYLLDLARPGGAEEERLPRGGDAGHDPLYLRLEAHVQHAICLIQHQVGHLCGRAEVSHKVCEADSLGQAAVYPRLEAQVQHRVGDLQATDSVGHKSSQTLQSLGHVRGFAPDQPTG